ncbi:MAG: neutral zinc metallopeptidase [Thermoleophilia bacterium]|nr:neutral zinc metallopeptidase [Thermoleophilia bacterium]
MRWKRVPGSGDVEDRRGRGGLGGGRMPLPIPIGKAGGGGLGVLLLVLAVLVLPGLLGDDGAGGLVPSGFGQAPAAPAGSAPGADTVFEFTKFVSKDAQDFWAGRFADGGRSYQRAPVVVFTSGTGTGCGAASAATGPFYCPLDGKVYLDLSFFRELARRFGAPGDFAQAYVIAHEVAHHVQAQLGIERRVRELRDESPDRANEYSVRLELQADCLAGVWAHSTFERGLVEEGDVGEGLGAAEAVGDDRLGARAPESWTHGSSAQRVEWWRRGFDSGDPERCDTFADA